MLAANLSGLSPIGPMSHGGRAAFAQEMRLIRDEAAWTNR
jgi:hypothetical protein